MRRITLHDAIRLVSACASAWALLASPAHAQDRCEPVDVTPDATVHGSLASSDCTLSDLGLSDRDLLVDPFRVTLPTGGVLTVSLESSTFDPFLGIVDPNDSSNQIAVDDDGGNGLNSLISNLSLGPGTYLVLAHACLDAQF